ncbi:MAG: OmpA family protein [Phenylobacterium sp.]|nr:OmpA family protein [Phenylobacterium sp.]
MRFPTRHVAISGLCLAGVVALGGCQAWRGGWAQDSRCEPVTAEIYFEPNSAELGPEARGLISATAERSDGCKVESVEVLGLADATGAADMNQALSEARATAVTAALAQAGLPAAAFNTQAAGQLNAVTADGVDRPMRRRVEIVLRLARTD